MPPRASASLERRRAMSVRYAERNAVQPPPRRAQEAGVVHHAVPAAPVQVGAVVVAVLGEEQAVPDALARPRPDLVVDVHELVATNHVGDVDAPTVQALVQPLPEHAVHAAA